MVGAKLPVIAALGIGICRTVQHTAHLGVQRPDAVVLAALRQILPGQSHLCDLAEQTGIDILPAKLFVLDHIESVFQAVRKPEVKIARTDGIIIDVGGHKVLVQFLLFCHHHNGAVHKGVLPDKAAKFLVQVIGVAAHQIQFVLQPVFRNGRCSHHQDQAQDRIALRFGVAGGKVRHRPRIAEEELTVIPHVIPQQIIFRQYIDEGLLPPLRDIGAQGGKEIIELVLCNDKFRVPGLCAPQVAAKADVLIQSLLLIGQVGKFADLGVVLTGDPADILDRGFVLAVPVHPGDLIFQGDGGQFDAAAQITGLLAEQLLMLEISRRRPAHSGIDGAGGRCHHMGELGVEHMGQRIHKAVDLVVADIVGRLFLCGQQLGRPWVAL